MEIILMEHDTATTVYEDYLEDYLNNVRSTWGKGNTNDMVIPDAEEIKVGYQYIRVRFGGHWYHWRRRDIACLAVDGKVYPLHGENFVRINCLLTEEELAEAKQKAQEMAEDFKSTLVLAKEAAITATDEALQERLAVLDKEYASRI